MNGTRERLVHDAADVTTPADRWRKFRPRCGAEERWPWLTTQPLSVTCPKCLELVRPAAGVAS